ncbi:MAG: hypothetical protein F6K62_19770 [Sphaerospermopsis sp. SIO1G2]|nr:hypothetical protein [Sphaerospermopsis sp. SIO1G1]NET73083.1 hypothetical protein [Sphaerospermopsis sp. SIO1G2]
MSAKLKFVLILIFSVLATTTGIHLVHNQPTTLITDTANGQQQIISVDNNPSISTAYQERLQYTSIPLENISSILQGSDPETLALNILYDLKSVEGRPVVQVTYPQPNQALVMITKVKQVKDSSVNDMIYRVEMNRFGRSLLVTSPPVWQIVWAGSQVKCSSSSVAQKQVNCDS